ncbi:hypothetical protein DIE11_16065 [Burkholderia sp. Bp9012]|nr:hypothetical protein DIE11_16065 [Burkholderia sp. Bp9012]
MAPPVLPLPPVPAPLGPPGLVRTCGRACERMARGSCMRVAGGGAAVLPFDMLPPALCADVSGGDRIGAPVPSSERCEFCAHAAGAAATSATAAHARIRRAANFDSNTGFMERSPSMEPLSWNFLRPWFSKARAVSAARHAACCAGPSIPYGALSCLQLPLPVRTANA